MFRKITLLAFASAILVSCGDNPFVRAGTGATLGAAAAYGVDGNPLVGALVGGGIGYITNRDRVDFGEDPLAAIQ